MLKFDSVLSIKIVDFASQKIYKLNLSKMLHVCAELLVQSK
jgi:hypothetical protein